jgi:hypothetical protein
MIPILDFGFWIADCGFWIGDCGLWIGEPLGCVLGFARLCLVQRTLRKPQRDCIRNPTYKSTNLQISVKRKPQTSEDTHPQIDSLAKLMRSASRSKQIEPCAGSLRGGTPPFSGGSGGSLPQIRVPLAPEIKDQAPDSPNPKPSTSNPTTM